jgi:hypothetical protein
MKRAVLFSSAVVCALCLLILFMGCSSPVGGDPGLSSASSLCFTDSDPDLGEIGGDIIIGRAAEEAGITHYRLYWTPDKTAESGTLLIEIPKSGADIVFPLPENSVSGTNNFLLCKTVNGADEEEEEGVSIEIEDYTNDELPTSTYEFYKPLEADENGMINRIPVIFNVFETDPAISSNNVHQVVLVFDPRAEQLEGGAGFGGLYFQVYLPGASTPSININNPPMDDEDESYVNNYGGDEGYQIVLAKVEGQIKWRLKIRYNPLKPDYLLGVVGDIHHSDLDNRFIFVARNVMLADPEPGSRMSAVDVTMGSRTRVEYNDGEPLGKTGIRFDPPPAVFISMPFLAGNNEISRHVPAGADTPYWIETFKAFASNDEMGELSGGKWMYFSPDGSEDAEREEDIWIDREFNLLGEHILRYEVHEPIAGMLTSVSYRYIWVTIDQE